MVINTKTIKLVFSICLAVLLLVAIFNRQIFICVKGMSYMANDVDNYIYTISSIKSDCTFSVDLNNLDDNVGKIIYEDNDCKIIIDRIIIDQVQQNGYDYGIYRIIFRSYGTRSIKGAKLISGIYHEVTKDDYTNKPSFAFIMGASMQCEYNGKTYNSKTAGVSGINYRNGDEFAFYIFPPEAYNNNEIVIENVGVVKIKISNLIENKWELIKN